mmetsp:Transcript_55224/g.124399  ORF Transcript_55224/g.124399 Transcript_55224/m.124399 type:complete len:167 (-) Transcript_55224:89-589(-)
MSRAPFPDVQHLHSVKVDVKGEWSSGEMLSIKEELRDKFGKFGDVGDVYVTKNRNIAFVRYRGQRDAEDATDSMDGKTIGGLEINCSMSMQRKRMPDEFENSNEFQSGGRSRSPRRDSSRGRDDRRRQRKDSRSRDDRRHRRRRDDSRPKRRRDDSRRRRRDSRRR